MDTGTEFLLAVAAETYILMSFPYLYQCWETYVGQQIYKLVVTDFIMLHFTILAIEFPKRQVTLRGRFNKIEDKQVYRTSTLLWVVVTYNGHSLLKTL